MSAPKKPASFTVPAWMLKQKEAVANKKSGEDPKWTVLKDAIGQIYEEKGASLSFQVLYDNAFQLVLHKQGDLLYNGVQSTISLYVQQMKDKILGSDDSTFLSVLLENWNKHRKSVLNIRDILLYMEKNYIEPVNKTGKTPIYQYGVSTFGTDIIRNERVTARTQRLILALILEEREGGLSVDRFLLKNLTSMLLEIGSRDYYEPVFETKFLEESKTFFQKEAASYFDSTTAPEYLQKVQVRLNSERERAERCLDEATKPKVEVVLKEQMIQAYVDRIIHKDQSGVQAMLEFWREDDLRLVFEVLGLHEGALTPVIDRVREFCKKEGLAIVEDESLRDKPNDMVEKLIDLRQKYEDLLLNSFSAKQGGVLVRDKEFSNAVKRGFEDIVNKNERLPEFLSLYVDSKLKRGKTQIPESEYDILFERVISIFRHMREKDVFERYYKTHLGSRLLGGRSASDEAEKSFITKLKAEFGYQFTSKLEGMFTDMRLSKDYNENYQKFLTKQTEKPGFDMSIHVLTTGSWPVNTSTPCNLPEQVLFATDLFKKFYLQTHSGRKLTWQFNMGTADVKVNGFSKNYELNVSTYQTIVLLLFNENKVLTYNDIANQTKIPLDDLKKNLISLTAKSKNHNGIMKKTGEPTVLEPGTEFSLNEGFKSKLVKVKINPVKLIDEKPEETIEKINEDRKWQLDAGIVRVMKARKTMDHRNLVIEVTKMLSSRFMPKPDDIKKRIESLIEREYLERSEESRSRYNYLA